MDRDDFLSSLEKIYKPLKGRTFEATYEGRRDTIRSRDVLAVQSSSIIAILHDIVDEVNELQQEYNRQEGCSDEDTERVWKGITIYGGVKLWVPPCEDPECGDFRVADIEVLTDLNWVNKDLIALVNISVVENAEESD